MTVSTYAPELDNAILELMVTSGEPVDSVLIIEQFGLNSDHFEGDGPAVRRAFKRLLTRRLIQRIHDPKRPQAAIYGITAGGCLEWSQIRKSTAK